MKSAISLAFSTVKTSPYGSKHGLRRYLTLQIIVNYTPVPLPKKVLGSIGDFFRWQNVRFVPNRSKAGEFPPHRHAGTAFGRCGTSALGAVAQR